MKKSILLIALCLLSIHTTKSSNNKEEEIKKLEQQIKNIKDNDPNWENTIKASKVRLLEKQIEKLQSSTSTTTPRLINLTFPPLPTKKRNVNTYNINNTPKNNIHNLPTTPPSHGNSTGGGGDLGTQIVIGLIVSVIGSLILTGIGFLYNKATASENNAKRRKSRRRAY